MLSRIGGDKSTKTSMNNSLSLINAKHDQKGLKNPKLTIQGQQLQTKSKFYSLNGTKHYSINNDAQQPLLQLGFRINEKLIGTGSYAKVKYNWKQDHEI